MWGGDPGAVEASGSGGLVVGGDKGAGGDDVPAEEFVFEVLIGGAEAFVPLNG